MKINQLSLFLENKPGRLSSPCHILAKAGINILTLSLADTQQFGIMRLIVRDWQRALDVLQKAGMVVNVTEVVAIEVDETTPAAPDYLGAAVAPGGGIDLTWDASAGATSYNVSRSTEGGLPFSPITPTAAAITAAISGATVEVTF